MPKGLSILSKRKIYALVMHTGSFSISIKVSNLIPYYFENKIFLDLPFHVSIKFKLPLSLKRSFRSCHLISYGKLETNSRTIVRWSPSKLCPPRSRSGARRSGRFHSRGDLDRDLYIGEQDLHTTINTVNQI